MAPKPLRSIKVDDEIWQPSIAKTAREGTSVTALLTTCLKQYNAGALTLVAERDVLSFLSDLVDMHDEDSDVRQRTVLALDAALARARD